MMARFFKPQPERIEMKKLTFAVLAATLATSAFAQNYKVEDAIKWRQSAYQILYWNTERLDQNLKSGQFSKDDAIKAANTIAAIANSGMGQLYFKGTEQSDKIQTRVKPEMFTDAQGAKDAAIAFAGAANELQKVAQTGDATAIAKQLEALGNTCGGCHKKFKQK